MIAILSGRKIFAAGGCSPCSLAKSATNRFSALMDSGWSTSRRRQAVSFPTPALTQIDSLQRHPPIPRPRSPIAPSRQTEMKTCPIPDDYTSTRKPDCSLASVLPRLSPRIQSALPAVELVFFTRRCRQNSRIDIPRCGLPNRGQPEPHSVHILFLPVHVGLPAVTRPTHIERLSSRLYGSEPQNAEDGFTGPLRPSDLYSIRDNQPIICV